MGFFESVSGNFRVLNFYPPFSWLREGHVFWDISGLEAFTPPPSVPAPLPWNDKTKGGGRAMALHLTGLRASTAIGWRGLTPCSSSIPVPAALRVSLRQVVELVGFV